MTATTIAGVAVHGLGERDVVVRGAVIEAVATPGAAAPEGEVVDGRGHTLVPGLVDTHVHLTGPDELAAAAAAGVTTVVDLGTHPDELVDSLRAEAAAGGISDLVSAGSAASAPGSTQIAFMGFPAASGVTGPGDAERYLDWRVERGSDLIKIIIEDPATTDVPALATDTLAALVTGARRRGLMTVAHVVTAGAFARGLDAGVDVLTHAPLDRPLSDDVLTRMVAAGTVVSPTLVMMRAMAAARLGDRAGAAFAISLGSVRAMHEAGVRIVAGTDANSTPIAPVAHGSSLHSELALLREAGMSPHEALLAATAHAAEVFGLADRGAVVAGRRADLVLVRGAIADDLVPLAAPVAVWAGGRRAV